MVTVSEVRGLAERLAKAEALVKAGAVHPVAGAEGLYVVVNGTGDQYYLVKATSERQCCSCPDFRHRQREQGLVCKHQLAVMIHQEQASKPAKPAKAGKATEPALSPEALAAGVTAEDLAILYGEDR